VPAFTVIVPPVIPIARALPPWAKLRPQSGQAAARARAEIALTEDNRYFPADLDDLAAAYSEVSRNNRLLTLRYREVVFGENE
jgi:hypothetical protein